MGMEVDGERVRLPSGEIWVDSAESFDDFNN